MRNDEVGRIAFLGGDDWTAEGLADFLGHLAVLYNRMVVLRQDTARSPNGLIAQLYASRSRVSDHEKLSITGMVIQSPMNVSFEGLGEVIREIRETFKDIGWRGRLERELMEEQLGHTRAMNKAEEQLARVKVFDAAAAAVDRLGATPDEKKKIFKAILDPAEGVAQSMSDNALVVHEEQPLGASEDRPVDGE